MNKISQIFISLVITIGSAGLLAVAMPSTNASAACTQQILTFPTWYQGLIDKDTCEIIPPDKDNENSLTRFIWKIVLNVVDMLMQLIGYASVVFLIIGGFRYITATGEPGKMSAAKTTITNAIIGLAIALASVAIVNAIAGVI